MFDISISVSYNYVMENLCNICPRNCNADRIKNLGFCKATNSLKISKVMLHYYEEPIISGEISSIKKQNGSGTIFFTNCNLKCIYCQNSEISSDGIGKDISPEKLCDIFKQIEESGANNINLVTPTHFTMQIIEALKLYKPKIPIVWNTSGYEKEETIKLLAPYVDIYLTDLKYFSENISSKLSLAPNYFSEASKAILQMRKNQPEDIIKNGLMKKGLIVRHLVLPGQTKDSEKIIDWIYENLGNETILSLMSQYVPMGNASSVSEINRKIKPVEYKILLNKVKKLGFVNAFVQDFESAETIYTPDFKTKTDKFNY